MTVLAGWEFCLRRPVGDGPAGPTLIQEAFQQSWSTQQVLLVGMGDSITAGFGASRGRSYFERLVHLAPEDFPDHEELSLTKVFPRLQSTNLAISGCTSLQLVRAQLPKLTVQSSNVLGLVVLTIGGNDLIHNYGMSAPVEGAMFGATWEQAQPWVQRFQERLDLILDQVQAAFPAGCHIFLANIYDPSDGTGSLRLVGLPGWKDGPRLHAEFNRILASAAKRRASVHLVDIHAAFLGHGIACRQFWHPSYQSNDPHWWYHANIEDPNDRGYDALRRLFLNEMAMALSPIQWR